MRPTIGFVLFLMGMCMVFTAFVVLGACKQNIDVLPNESIAIMSLMGICVGVLGTVIGAWGAAAAFKLED